MSNVPYGAAARITVSNYRKFSFLTGVTPSIKNTIKPTYFVCPYAHDGVCEILEEAEFNEKYRFDNAPNPNMLVDVSLK